MKLEWIRCPLCGSKTRNRIREDTILKNYPLYCPKCRQEKAVTELGCQRGHHRAAPYSRLGGL